MAPARRVRLGLVLSLMLLAARVEHVSGAARGCVSDCINDRGGLSSYVRYQVNPSASEQCPNRLCVYRGQLYENFVYDNYEGIDYYGSVVAKYQSLVDARAQAWQEAYYQVHHPALNGTDTPILGCGPVCLAIIPALGGIVAACVSAEHCFCSVCWGCSGCRKIDGQWYNVTHLAMTNATHIVV